MSIWNYVVTAHKPTNVTHSCVGNFTSPHELNLIIAKCTRIEIHLLAPQGLQPVLDVPIYGRIATLELFRPHGETQDLLFVATERYKFCVLQWDAETSELITRAMGDVSDRIGRPTDNGQIGIIDPDCRLIGLHLYDGLFKSYKTTYRHYHHDHHYQPEGINKLLWCVAIDSGSWSDLPDALDWTCGPGMANCTAIQEGGPCFEPDTLVSHASYAFNNYYQQNGRASTACDFHKTATITEEDPSCGTCIYEGSTRSLGKSSSPRHEYGFTVRIARTLLLIYVSM